MPIRLENHHNILLRAKRTLLYSNEVDNLLTGLKKPAKQNEETLSGAIRI